MTNAASSAPIVPDIVERPFLELVWGTGNAGEILECRAGCEWQVTSNEAVALHGAIVAPNAPAIRGIIERYSPSDPQHAVRRILELALSISASNQAGRLSMLGKVKPNLVVIRDAEFDFGSFRVQCEVAFNKTEFFDLAEKVLPPRTPARMAEAKTIIVEKAKTAPQSPVTFHQEFLDILALAVEGQRVPGP